MRKATETAAHATIRDYDNARLETLYPHTAQIIVAVRLAKDVQTCRALLAGDPVDPSRVHKNELENALKPGLVQLVRPIDVLHGKAA